MMCGGMIYCKKSLYSFGYTIFEKNHYYTIRDINWIGINGDNGIIIINHNDTPYHFSYEPTSSKHSYYLDEYFKDMIKIRKVIKDYQCK